MKCIYTIGVAHGSCSVHEYHVIARSVEEAIRKARAEAKRDLLTNPDVKRLEKLGPAV
jgi:ribosomal protein S5